MDVWGAGCVAFELAVGTALFAGSSDIDQLSIICKTLGPLTRDQAHKYFQLTCFEELTKVRGMLHGFQLVTTIHPRLS